jgi:hypothetical protein
MLIPGELLDQQGRLFTKTKRPSWRSPYRVQLDGESKLYIWRSVSTAEAPEFLLDPVSILEASGFLPDPEPNENERIVHPPSDLLERFLDLSTACGPQICKFVQKYGPLGIFQHFGSPLNRVCSEIEWCEVWRYFAAVMGALLRIAEGVYSNSPGDPKDWSLIANWPRFPLGKDDYAAASKERRLYGRLLAEQMWIISTERNRPMTARQARSQLTFQMNLLLALGKIRPYFAWTSRSVQPQVLYAGSSLLSYLVLQLCFRMSKVDGYAFCDHCGKSYEPDRAPRADRRNFCQACQESRISAQLADRKWRQKERTRHRRSAAH